MIEQLRRAWPTAHGWREQSSDSFTAQAGPDVLLSVFGIGDQWLAELTGDVSAEVRADEPCRALRRLRAKLKRLVVVED